MAAKRTTSRSRRVDPENVTPWPIRRRIAAGSKRIADRHRQESEAMAGTLVDGLEPEGDEDRPMQIVVETPYGMVRSSVLPRSAVEEIKATLEGGIARVQHFTVNCDDGHVLIPSDTLRESMVRFVYCDVASADRAAK